MTMKLSMSIMPVTKEVRSRSGAARYSRALTRCVNSNLFAIASPAGSGRSPPPPSLRDGPPPPRAARWRNLLIPQRHAITPRVGAAAVAPGDRLDDVQAAFEVERGDGVAHGGELRREALQHGAFFEDGRRVEVEGMRQGGGLLRSELAVDHRDQRAGDEVDDERTAGRSGGDGELAG